MNKEQVRMSKACEISGKSRIFFDHNHLSHKDENGCVYVKYDDLKDIINDEFINAKEHLRRFETFQNQIKK